MKLLRQLRWHTANLKSGAQIRMKIQSTILKTDHSTLYEISIVTNCVQLLFLETRKGART
jgi:hypothetical protein